MGSCIPPKTCNPSVAVYDGFISSRRPLGTQKRLEDFTRLGSIELSSFQELAGNYWTSQTSGFILPAKTDEYARKFCLEASMVQIVRTKKEAAPNRLVMEIDGSSITIPIPDQSALTSSNSSFSGEFNDEAYSQSENFLMYLAGSVDEYLPNDREKLSYLFDYVDICIAGVNHTVFQAKSLVNAPRPNLKRSLPLPATSSWPAGHAYICGVVSAALFVALTKNLLGPDSIEVQGDIALQLIEMSRIICENRERAGLHFVQDSEAGYEAGFKVMSSILITAAKSTPNGISGELFEICGYLNRAVA